MRIKKIGWSARLAVGVVVLLGGVGLSHGQMLIDDFNEGNDDGWMHVDLLPDGGPGTFNVVPVDPMEFEYNLASSNDVTERGFLFSIWEGSGDPTFSNGILRATMRADTHATEPFLLMRTDLATFTTYGVAAVPSLTSPTLFKQLGPGSTEVLGDIGGSPLNVGEDWIVELGAVGDTISLKAWREGEPEPAAPQVSVTDTTITSGAFAVGAGSVAPPPAPLSATFDDIFFTVPEPTGATLFVIGVFLAGRRGDGRARERKGPLAPIPFNSLV